MTSDLTPPQANTLTVALTAAVFFALGFLIAFIMYSDGETTPTVSEQAQIDQAVRSTLIALTPTATPPPTPVPVADTLAEYSPVQGDIEAPIKMVEFSSYTCGFCGRFRRDTLPLLQEHYGDLFVFVARDFPRSDAEVVLNVAGQCAEEQNAFWAFTDQMWDNQIAASPLNIFAEDTLSTFAANADMDVESFNTCLQDVAIQQRVIADLNEARGFAVSATPTFFINGVRVVGAKPLVDFLDIIDAELEAQGITPPPRF